MQVHIRDIPPEGLCVDSDLFPAQLQLAGAKEREAAFHPPEVALEVEGPVHVTAEIRPVGTTLWVVGEVAAMVQLACSRCLKPFRSPIRSLFQLRYLPLEEMGKAAEQELAAADLDVAFFQGDALDLALLAREQILLALPMQPQCRESCKGLCPRCGQDWNEGPCTCATDEPDPRLSVLQAWSERGQSVGTSKKKPRHHA